MKRREAKPRRSLGIITKAKQVTKQATEHTVGLVKKYIGKSKQSIRHEILNLVVLAAVVALLVGTLTTSIAKGMGIGRYVTTQYNEGRELVLQRLTNATRKLNSLDYMEMGYNIDTYQIEDIIRNYTTTYTTENTTEDTRNVEVKYNEDDEITVEETTESLTVQRTKEAILSFQSYMDGCIVGHYNGEVYYPNEESLNNIIDPKAEQLFNTYADMIETNSWDSEKVYEEAEVYYQYKNSQAIVKEGAVEEILESLESMYYGVQDTKNYLLDSQGNVLYNQGIIKTIDIVQAIKNASTLDRNSGDDYLTNIYPVILNGEVHYLYNETVLQGEQHVVYSLIPMVLGGLVAIIVFVLLIFKLTTAKIRYIEYLSECLGEISKGNLDYIVEVRGEDELAKVAKDMSYMEAQLKKQIEERMQSERTKNELITNVAHDLRTPLTSIIGYIGLVKDDKYEDKEECARYLDIAYSKSERLKVLIEDLFEYTKLSNRVIDLKLEQISVTLLMNQLIEELRPQAEDKNISMSIHVKADESSVYVDIMKMARVFENLLENAIKYSKKDEVVQIIIQQKNGYVYTSVRNRCDSTPEADITKLFDRFYRTDTSRNSTTGGSGLGLAIAKNIVEMHGGKIWAQLDGDRISFNVKLKAMEC